MNLCVKISNRFPFQRIEEWALIRGMGAYSRGRLLDILVSRVGAYSRVGVYSREALIRIITVCQLLPGLYDMPENTINYGSRESNLKAIFQMVLIVKYLML